MHKENQQCNRRKWTTKTGNTQTIEWKQEPEIFKNITSEFNKTQWKGGKKKILEITLNHINMANEMNGGFLLVVFKAIHKRVELR